jgi:cytidylate kinase
MAVITISNEFTTRSHQVAAGAAERLGYEYVGDELLARIARELNLSRHEADTFRQASRTSILRFVDRYTCSIVQRVVDGEHGCLDDRAYYEKTRELVERIYEEGNAIIVGWGSQCILKAKPGTLHVRLKKETELKVRELVENQEYSRKAAEQKVRQEEADLRAYIRQYFNEDWNDARLYDLVIDMGTTTVEQAVALICEHLRQRGLDSG